MAPRAMPRRARQNTPAHAILLREARASFMGLAEAMQPRGDIFHAHYLSSSDGAAISGTRAAPCVRAALLQQAPRVDAEATKKTAARNRAQLKSEARRWGEPVGALKATFRPAVGVCSPCQERIGGLGPPSNEGLSAASILCLPACGRLSLGGAAHGRQRPARAQAPSPSRGAP